MKSAPGCYNIIFPHRIFRWCMDSELWDLTNARRVFHPITQVIVICMSCVAFDDQRLHFSFVFKHSTLRFLALWRQCHSFQLQMLGLKSDGISILLWWNVPHVLNFHTELFQQTEKYLPVNILCPAPTFWIIFSTVSCVSVASVLIGFLCSLKSWEVYMYSFVTKHINCCTKSIMLFEMYYQNRLSL
jgi:hypothetical protein